MADPAGAPSGQPLALAMTLTGHGRAVAGLAFSPDERMLVTASGDRTDGGGAGDIGRDS